MPRTPRERNFVFRVFVRAAKGTQPPDMAVAYCRLVAAESDIGRIDLEQIARSIKDFPAFCRD